MDPIELEDIQGLLIRAYGKLPNACYLLLRVNDAAGARQWLDDLIPRLATGRRGETATAINVAFTWPGLKAMGLDEKTLATFPRELQEGMHGEHRQRVLGDYGEGEPSNWLWGTEENEVHVLLILIAASGPMLGDLYRQEHELLERSGLEEVEKLPTTPIVQRKEHFGFHDGISQPYIKGLSKTGRESNTIMPGEFILGYPNEYDKIPDSPTVDAARDPENLLKPYAPADGRPLPRGEELHDLGRNGSYLVFRQLQQKVKEFWEFIDRNTRNPDGSSNAQERLLLAAKMVGRWPSGAPLVKSPEADNGSLHDDDDFFYHGNDDAEGLKCPLGAHVRRANPRDTKGDGPEDSIRDNNRHRILRRGRSYGPPLADTMNPEDFLAAEDDPNIDRGLHFICFNANIGRQFEFIQQTWINNPKFMGLYEDPDPIMGKPDKREAERRLSRNFTIQDSPVRRRVTELPAFVEVRGGAYFFFPGIRALRFIASFLG